MRLLHVSAGYWPFHGGAERHMQGISERLVADGHEVVVLCGDARAAEQYWIPGGERLRPLRDRHNGVEIVRVPVAHLLGSRHSFPTLRRAAIVASMLPGTTPLLRRAGRYLPWLPDYERALERVGQVDLVHGFNISLEAPMLAGWRRARSLGVPFVATPFVHTGVPGDRSVERHYTMRHQLEMLRDADHLFTMSTIERDRLADLGVARERMSVLGVGLDPVDISPAAIDMFRAAHGIEGRYVAFIGSATRDKGAIDLVEAARALWRDGVAFELVFAGIPVTEFNDHLVTLPPADRARLRLLGPISEEEKWALLAGCSLLVMPSRVDSFGIVFLEAWSQGRPVVAARAGGVPDVVTDGEDGLLVPYGDRPALARALRALLEDRTRADALGARGRETVARRFAWPRLYGAVREVLERLAGSGERVRA